jgi:hypothetical protein
MKPAQVAVLDQVVGMLVVSREADVTANVVHQRRIFQPFALAVRESMHRTRLVEERERQPYYLIGMISVIAAALCEFQRAPAPYIRDAVDLRDLPPVAAHVIEHEPFTQREVAEGQFLGAEAAKNRVKQNRAGHDQIRAPGVEARDAQPALEIEFGDLLSNFSNLLNGDVQIAQLCWSRPACGGRSDRSNAENGPGCADHAVETGRKDLFAVAIDFAKHMLDDLPLVALGERVALHEAFGQPYRPNLEAASKLQGGGRAERDFHAATADVDNHGASASYIHAIDGGLMNEPRLLGSRNDTRSDAGFVFAARQEFAAVAGLARGAGRGRENLINLVRVRDSLELRQRLQGSAHRFRRESSAVETTCPQPDHRFFAVDHLERQVRAHANDNHVNRVRADIDGCYPHRAPFKPDL